ncbi:hypothetical protein F2P81_005656 [Scophthalmus maximus]|uniref:Uncharacterized protein n=1 Tax=Scophthalmus maximus TaxID=52904 RepID=A0A6A4TFX2_SCOMX|nr:hypothetical protein F2P81_005656 [Scophthalmus maximus]
MIRGNHDTLGTSMDNFLCVSPQSAAPGHCNKSVHILIATTACCRAASARTGRRRAAAVGRERWDLFPRRTAFVFERNQTTLLRSEAVEAQTLGDRGAFTETNTDPSAAATSRVTSPTFPLNGEQARCSGHVHVPFPAGCLIVSS